MSKEAMKLVLEALEAATRYGAGGFEDAKDALREALAEQPAQQEPVAWMQNTTAGLYVIDHYDKWHCIPLYTNPQAQRTWVGLTDEEIQTTWNSVMRGDVFTRRDVYKAIEAKLREKST